MASEKRKTKDGVAVRTGMFLWTADGCHVERVKSVKGAVVRSEYIATRWPGAAGMPVDELYSGSKRPKMKV
jgi:hypothetical protein